MTIDDAKKAPTSRVPFDLATAKFKLGERLHQEKQAAGLINIGHIDRSHDQSSWNPFLVHRHDKIRSVICQ